MKKSPAYYWPAWLTASFPGTKINQAVIKKFQTAQESLWLALNIYDDFLDGAGQPNQLPVANGYYRNFLETLYLTKLTPSLQKASTKILNDLDSENQRELQNDKIIWANGRPTVLKKRLAFHPLKNLSKKSLALALLPIAAVRANKKLDERRLINFFRLALAAKQLSDDAKDWLDDWRAGKLTAVTALIIEEGAKQKLKKNLYHQNEILHLLFAQGAAIPTCYNILKLCQQARVEAARLRMKDRAPILKKIITPLEKAAHKALRFQALLSE